MWLALSSDGQMSRAEMLKELARDQVCPVMFYRKDGKPTVPLFGSMDLAVRFAARNTPKGWTIATMEADDKDLARLREDGFEFETLEWHCRRDTEVHVLYLDREVATHAAGFRNQLK